MEDLDDDMEGTLSVLFYISTNLLYGWEKALFAICMNLTSPFFFLF